MQLLTNDTKTNHVNLTVEQVSKKLSKQYAPVSTELLLRPFLNKGWQTSSTLSNKTKSKELITLRHKDYTFLNGDSFDIIVQNSYDGSASLKFFYGVGRVVCMNGMVIGDMESEKFIHRGNKIYTDIEESYERIVAKLEEVKNKVDRLNNLYLAPSHLDSIINNIAGSVFNSESDKKKVEVLGVNYRVKEKLLERHRTEDNTGADNAWILMNVIQENIVRKGRLEASIRETNKETKEIINRNIEKRATEGKLSSFRLNHIISEEFFKAVS